MESVCGVGVAAVAALRSELPDAMARDAGWEGYVGMGVWPQTSEHLKTVFETYGPEAVVVCPKAAHTYAPSRFALVATACNRLTAMRAPRVSAAVLSLVCQGALAPRIARAELLLPLVARFCAEVSIRHERAGESIDDLLAEDECTEKTTETEAETATETTAERSSEPSSSPMPSASSSGADDATPVFSHTMSTAVTVPSSYLLDYIVLVAVRDLLHGNAVPGNGNGLTYVPVSRVVEHLYNMQPPGAPVTPLINGTSRPSMRQSVGRLLKHKVARRGACSGAHGADDVVYGDTPSWVDGHAGLCVTNAGRRRLAALLQDLLSAMQAPVSAGFAREWHPSRSARSHARRKHAHAVA